MQQGVSHNRLRPSHLGAASSEPINERKGAMATVLKARGRMTKDLVSPYHVGDPVVSLVSDLIRIHLFVLEPEVERRRA